MHIGTLFMFAVVLPTTSVLVRPVVLDGSIAELNIAAVEISNASSSIQSAGHLAPEGGHDQAGAALLLELEQYTEDLAREAHALWVNVSRVGKARASVAALERGGSIIVSSVLGGGARWNLSHSDQSKGETQGNLTVTDADELDKPKSKKSKSVPGLQAAKAVVLQAMQHVQSAARATSFGNRASEDLVSTVELVMDRARELYNVVEVTTARVAGGKDAQTRVEKELDKIQRKISKRSVDLGSDALSMTRELRLVKHAVREAVGGSTRHDVTQAARESLRSIDVL